MPEHPQLVIDPDGTTADEKIAPLVKMVREHGLNTHGSCQGGGEGDYALAYIVFHTATDALEFLLHSANLLNYQVGDRIAVTVHRPLGGLEPGGKALWHPALTPELTAAWRAQ